jgi:hypothetical protein
MIERVQTKPSRTHGRAKNNIRLLLAEIFNFRYLTRRAFCGQALRQTRTH